jgi:transposase
MPIGAALDITEIQRFFLQPREPRQRQYEALRAFYVEGLPSAEAAARFGYTPGSFRVLCHAFRREPQRAYFAPTGPRRRRTSRMAKARDRAVALRKRNFSIYDISEALREEKLYLSPSAVREVLNQEGFAPLPRRLDEERTRRVSPTIEPVADARAFVLTQHSFSTTCGGLFLFVPDIVRLGLDTLAATAGMPGSAMIPPAHALRAALALKLWSIERKSHVMALTADEGLALFAGLNAIPKKSYLSEYSHRLEHSRTLRLLAGWHDALADEKLLEGDSFNLDFHSVPYYGESPIVERHYVSMRSRRQPSVLAFLAQEDASRVFCYSNADIRKGEEAEEVFNFVKFWKAKHGALPGELVFDSKLTTYKGLARLDTMHIPFITLRRRTSALLAQITRLPSSAWRVVELESVTRRFRTPRVYEQRVTLAGCHLRQFFIEDLGHEEPTVLLTNQHHATPKRLITRYAQRMLIENALSDAVRFFHMNALSSAVGLKVDFDMVLLVIASGLYRLLARRMRGYSEAQARQIFRDLVDMPADVVTSPTHVSVNFRRRAHTPILLASDLFKQPVHVPWWNGATLTLTA